MKIEECLRQLSPASMDTLVKTLRIESPSAKPAYYVHAIKEIMSDWSHFERRIFRYFTTEQVQDLVKIVYSDKVTADCIHLERHGVLFSGQMPTDVRQMLRVNLSGYLLHKFPDKQDTVHIGFFLKVCLFLNLLRSLTPRINIQSKQFNTDVSDYRLHPKQVERILACLQDLTLITHERQYIELCEPELTRWEGLSDWDRFMSVYSTALSNHEIPLLQIVSDYQRQTDDWVDITYFDNVDSAVMRQILQRCELMEFHQSNSRHYARLTPDGWYFVKEQTPVSWTDRAVIVTADFEVFVPHHYDPFFITSLARFTQFREMDYFVIFDVEPTHTLDEKLLEMLEQRSLFLPDVVKHAFTHA